MEYSINLGEVGGVWQNVCNRLFMKVHNLIHKVFKFFLLFLSDE